MGQIKNSKIIFLIICFLATGALLNLQAESTPSVKKQKLNQALAEINGWKISGISPLKPKIITALELDDYVFQAYTNGKENISLYIGYYLSGKKVGAAHDPLVCFPGQGWELSNTSTGTMKITPSGTPIKYSTILATRGMEKTFILYWFQSYDQTNADTFSQKISLLKWKLLNKGEDNAFVRLSVPLGDKTPEECKAEISGFVCDFYPVFLEFILEGTS